jgi:hypothetical protein
MGHRAAGAGRLSVALAALLLATSWAGCDSDGNDAASDAEVLAGEWVLSRVLLDGQDLTVLVLAEVDRIEVRFGPGDGFEMEVRVDDQTAAELGGTYVLDEEDKTITLQSSSFEAPVTLDYAIRQDGARVVLTSDDIALLAELAGIDPGSLGIEVDQVDLELVRDS